MTIEDYTDLDRLRRIFKEDNPERGADRTFAECQALAGVLAATKQSGVVCRVVKYDRVKDIMNMLIFKVFPGHEISFQKTISRSDFSVVMPGGVRKRISFKLFDDKYAVACGNMWPIVNFTESDERDKDGKYKSGI